jgi:hypothetical protein
MWTSELATLMDLKPDEVKAFRESRRRAGVATRTLVAKTASSGLAAFSAIALCPGICFRHSTSSVETSLWIMHCSQSSGPKEQALIQHYLKKTPTNSPCLQIS